MQSGVSTRGDLVLIDTAPAQVSGEGAVIVGGVRERGAEVEKEPASPFPGPYTEGNVRQPQTPTCREML